MMRIVVDIEDTHIEAERVDGEWMGKVKDNLSEKEGDFKASDAQMSAIAALAIDGDPHDADMIVINANLRLIAAPILEILPEECCIVP